MQLPSLSFDPDTVTLVGRVCDEAWEEARSRLGLPAGMDARGLRDFVAVRLMAAVAVGQRDPERLKAIALDALAARGAVEAQFPCRNLN